MRPDWTRHTVWVGAYVSCAAVCDAARPLGLRLPPDPSSGAFATSGGLVATNAAGPRSVRSGSVRHWVEALEVIEADGATPRLRRGGGGRGRVAPAPGPAELVPAPLPEDPK